MNALTSFITFVCAKARISLIIIPCDEPLPKENVETLILVFSLADNFFTASAMVFIFHTDIPCDKIFVWVHNLLTFDLFI